jgi:hypothetical protein
LHCLLQIVEKISPKANAKNRSRARKAQLGHELIVWIGVEV